MLQGKIKAVSIALTLGLGLLSATAHAVKGLSEEAYNELEATGLNKYLGEYQPVSSEELEDGWTRHNFDAAAGHGPVCIDGSDYAVFTREGKNPTKLLVMLQGGGACWEGLEQCRRSVAGQEPPFPRVGIWNFDTKKNPLRNYSIVYFPYCDGSVFTGDNEVNDDSVEGGIRYHRGLRNVSAGLDVAADVLKKPQLIVVAGTSAGGVGAAAFAPLLVRFQYGNQVKKLVVINDAGPVVTNPPAVDAAAARAADWAFDQFYPASCTECDGINAPVIPFLKWLLANDNRVREGFYSTDGDATAIQFTSVNLPGSPFYVPFDPANGVLGLEQETYREIILPAHGSVNSEFPDRYKRFLVSGDDSHTALQTPLFYTQLADGVPLNEWVRDLIKRKNQWADIVEDFEPLAE